MSKRLCKDWSGYTIMDVLGKVTVKIRNGYLSTGYESVTKTLPSFLRCYEIDDGKGGGTRKWFCGASETHVPALDGMYPNAVVQHYRKKAREKLEAEQAEALRVEVPSISHPAACTTRSANSRLSVPA